LFFSRQKAFPKLPHVRSAFLNPGKTSCTLKVSGSAI